MVIAVDQFCLRAVAALSIPSLPFIPIPDIQYLHLLCGPDVAYHFIPLLLFVIESDSSQPDKTLMICGISSSIFQMFIWTLGTLFSK